MTTNPITQSLELLRVAKYAEAAALLAAEFDRHPKDWQLARISNLISVGMINDAIHALRAIQFSFCDYAANKPQDEDIGCVVPFQVAALAVG